MAGLSAEAVVAIWEQIPNDDPVRGPLVILAHACPELPEEELLGMSIGERDSRLLQLRQQLFGDRLAGFVHCPQCSEQLEFGVSVAEILRRAPDRSPTGTLEFVTGDLKARLRFPDSRDLLAVQALRDPGAAAQLLLELCVEDLEYQGAALPARDLPAALVARIGEQLSQYQPAADVELIVACDDCEYAWSAQLDIASYFHSELKRYAQRLLDQVHTLAAAYGWQEQVILAMQPQRRQAYLERVLA